MLPGVSLRAHHGAVRSANVDKKMGTVWGGRAGKGGERGGRERRGGGGEKEGWRGWWHWLVGIREG